MDVIRIMRLVFIGSSGFGLKCLQACLEIPELKVIGVVTAPKKFTISYRPQGVTNVLHEDLAALAEANNIQVAMLRRSMSDPTLLESVAAWKPDAFLVVGWYHMIPKRWRKLAPAYGLHASLLPDYSGGAPLVWAMINGETKTGITCFQMDDGVDSGPIAGQREEIILSDDTIATLYARIEQQGLQLLYEVLPAMAAGTLNLRAQDEPKRRVMPQRFPEDGYIDWNQEAEAIIRFIRAQTKPYPGAFTTLDEKELFIWSATLAYPTKDHAIGQVQRTAGDIFVVCCKKGAIALAEVSYKSKTYSHIELVRLLRDGGQYLGIKPSR
jgi:methionyl-tRNA formyltransferase